MSDQLRALGIDLIEGFGADQLALAPDMFVVGNVVSRARLPDGSPKFPLMEAILDAGKPYTSGPQWLAEHVLQGRHVLAVAGTHGKTTTTSMLAWVLEQGGKAPGFLVGGVPLDFGVSARLGDGPAFVIEADEYDTAFFDKRSKFVHYRPRTAVLNNLEFDHADIFDDLAAIERQFHHLVRTVPGTGRLVVNATEESLQRVLAQGCWSELARFGDGGPATEWQARGTHDAFDVLHRGEVVGRVEWELSGLHNQMNALAAIAAADHVGVPPADAARALGRFRNVRRRMELRGTVEGQGGAITVYDDFAHHPTAIRTTLDGLRKKLDDAGKQSERILAAFGAAQQHDEAGRDGRATAVEPGIGRPVVLPHGRPRLGRGRRAGTDGRTRPGRRRDRAAGAAGRGRGAARRSHRLHEQRRLRRRARETAGRPARRPRMMNGMRARELIDTLKLQPHPEGGWYSEVFRSAASVTPADGRARAAR